MEASIQQCNRMRAQTGIRHQIIAAACSVDHARQIAALYTECGYRAVETAATWTTTRRTP